MKAFQFKPEGWNNEISKVNQNNIEESNNKEENTSMIVIQEEKWYQKISKRIFVANTSYAADEPS